MHLASTYTWSPDNIYEAKHGGTLVRLLTLRGLGYAHTCLHGQDVETLHGENLGGVEGRLLLRTERAVEVLKERKGGSRMG